MMRLKILQKLIYHLKCGYKEEKGGSIDEY